MTNKFRPSGKAFFTILEGAFLCIAFLLSSCDHFMEGAKTSEALEKVIAYANTPAYKILVEADKDSGIITKPAAGEADVKESDIFNLAFNAESDHQFIRWEIYDAATGKEIKDNTYLQIENPDMIDTTCTVLALPKDENIKLAVRAVAAQRPQAIFTFPVWQQNGTNRNSDIKIKFNRHDMSPECIYYSEEEMKNLKKELNLTDTDFLKGNQSDCGGRYYGYEKDGIRYFKNIQLMCNTTGFISDQNYPMNYYCNPFWYDNPNDLGATLVLQTKNVPPDGGLTIYVKLDKNFYYIQDDVPVKLIEPSISIIKTSFDNEPPYNSNFNGNNEESIEVLDKNGEYVPLARETLSYEERQPEDDRGDYALMPANPPEDVVIPVCSDPNFIKLRFKFKAYDDGGSNLEDHFDLCYYNSSLYHDEPVYGPEHQQHRLPKQAIFGYDGNSRRYAITGHVSFTYQYIGRNYDEYVEDWENIVGYADIEDLTGEWSEEYAYIIPRTGALVGAQTICLAVYLYDNEQNTQCLEYNALGIHPKPYLFWLTLE